jgi:hypothetical protein
MGGFGSGRHGGKGLTSDYRALDVQQLGRLGRLTPGQAFDWSATAKPWESSECGRKPTR